jgi:hypothetical protein
VTGVINGTFDNVLGQKGRGEREYRRRRKMVVEMIDETMIGMEDFVMGLSNGHTALVFVCDAHIDEKLRIAKIN